ncbi:MAG: hypothetical protein DCC68_08425 [Planctomycetota bacterium]|nr:MAG: hypothetical protein DCC68_08425 [Planctomycetota bacterium]
MIFDGGFELGGVNWGVSSTYTVANSGGWFLSSVGGAAPLSGLPTDADGGGMNLYVVTDQLATGTMALFQTFTVPTDTSFRNLYLSFDMFVNDWSSQPTYNPSQHARVDIIAATGTAHLAASIFNAYLGTDGGPIPAEFRHYEFDVLPFLTRGQAYRVRFQTVVGVSQLNQGVDNVSILAVPEPATALLAASGFTVLASVVCVPRRLRRRLLRRQT